MSCEANLLPAVAVRHVRKAYRLYDRPIDRLKQALLQRNDAPRYGREFVALDDVSFVLPRGEGRGAPDASGAAPSGPTTPRWRSPPPARCARSWASTSNRSDR